MTFGPQWGWGSDKDECRRIFHAYVERGGNFIDTSSNYTEGTSEELVGLFSAGLRDRLVISTKYSLPTRSKDPNSGGNHRKSLVNSVNNSLQRLRTDYIDLLYLHIWDATTSYEEILRGMDDLVRSGKILYLGISNTPAWRVAIMQIIAESRGWSPLIAVQLEYNLIERSAERDLLPMACELGIGSLAWSPLRSGILTGKYLGSGVSATVKNPLETGSRENLIKNHGFLTARALSIANVVRSISEEINKPAAQIALSWVMNNPLITAPVIGARTVSQLHENIAALDLNLTDEQIARLREVSAVELGYPHDYLSMIRNAGILRGGVNIIDRSIPR